MKLSLSSGEIEVRPFNYKLSKQFQSKLEERTTLEKTEQSGWSQPFALADLVLEMLVSAVQRDFPDTARDEIETAFNFHEMGDWLAYLMRGPEAVKKAAAGQTTTITT